MRFSLLTRASQILVDNLVKQNCKLEDCKLRTLETMRPYGYIVFYAINNLKIVATISQDIYSAECSNNIEEAEKFMLNKINKLYGNSDFIL
jgi:hypothetical protein